MESTPADCFRPTNGDKAKYMSGCYDSINRCLTVMVFEDDICSVYSSFTASGIKARHYLLLFSRDKLEGFFVFF